MISVDTNIVIRFLTHDDEAQFAKALRTFNSEDIFIPDTVVLESERVLRYAYCFDPEDICGAFKALFGLKNVHLSNPSLFAQVIEWHLAGIDFADAMHLASSQHCKALCTFDSKFAKKAGGIGACKVRRP